MKSGDKWLFLEATDIDFKGYVRCSRAGDLKFVSERQSGMKWGSLADGLWRSLSWNQVGMYRDGWMFRILEVSMRASRAVSWANQILHVHFKSTNHNH